MQWLSDLREPNKVIKRKVDPLPKIAEVLCQRNGYKKYFSKLNISIIFYTFELDNESKKLCQLVVLCLATMNTKYCPWDVRSPPMSRKKSEIIKSILADIEATEVYIDDVGVFSSMWQ